MVSAMSAVPLALRAAGAVLAYCERAHIVISQDLLRIAIRTPGGAMRLDAHTRANLELFARLGERGASLLQLLDATRTPHGRAPASRPSPGAAHRRRADQRGVSTRSRCCSVIAMDGAIFVTR